MLTARDAMARAICIAIGDDPDAQDQGMAQVRWKDYWSITDAALAAIPITEAMVEAVAKRMRDDFMATAAYEKFGDMRLTMTHTAWWRPFARAALVAALAVWCEKPSEPSVTKS